MEVRKTEVNDKVNIEFSIHEVAVLVTILRGSWVPPSNQELVYNVVERLKKSINVK